MNNSNNETGEVIVATRVASASIAPATVPTFTPSPATSSLMRTEVGEHILSNTTSYNFINENDSEEYYTNIADMYNLHNNNYKNHTNKVERTEQSTQSDKTDSMEFYDANDKCAKCSSFYTSHSNDDNDSTERREQPEFEESISKKEWESELYVLENKVDVKLEKMSDETKAEVAETKVTKEDRCQSELEWQYSFAYSLPQIPVIETDEDDDDDDSDSENKCDSPADKARFMINVPVHIAEHNEKSEMESVSSRNATPNSVILASCRTISSSHTSPVLETDSNAGMNDYDWEYVCNTRQWSESDASTVSSAEMGSAKESVRWIDIKRQEEQPQQEEEEKEQTGNAHKAMNEKEEIYSKADNTNSFEKNCADDSHRHEETDKCFNKLENKFVSYSEEYNDHDYDCQNNQEYEYIDIEHDKHHRHTLQNFTNNSSSYNYNDDNNNYFDNNNSSKEVDANNVISMTNDNIHNSASSVVINNNTNSKLPVNNNEKHAEYLENSAFPLYQEISKGHNVSTNTERSIAKENYNNIELPHTHEITMQDKKNLVHPEYIEPTETTSSSSSSESSSSPILSKLEPSLYYHECLLEPEWQYVNNECNEQDRIPRVADEQLQQQRELIGRGGDRGSCVYRLSTKCIPSVILKQINLVKTTYTQNTSSSNEERMNIHNDNGNRIKEISNEENRYLALKMYPRAMLDNEIEFAEVLYKWQMQHRNRQDHNKLYFYSKCDEHEEELNNDSTKNLAYTTEEEVYAAKHLVISYALIMDENNVDCGILMPLYMCNLKAYLCKNGKEECNIMEYDVFDRDVCNVFNRHYGNNNNNSNDNSNNSSVVSSCSNGNERRDIVGHITNYDAEHRITQGINNVHINHDNADGSCDDNHNSKNKTTSKRSAFLYKQRYAPIHSMEVITAICFQLLESITFMSVSLGTFCNNYDNAEIEENEEMEREREPKQEQQYKESEKEIQEEKCIIESRCTGFIHNDIHVSNILLSESGTVALCDFELVSRNAEDVEHVEHTGYRLPPYARQSPFGLFSASSDTWAFGLIVLNLLTGVDPLFSNTEIMDDFGDGPLLMAYNSQDRRDGVEVLDWEANIKDYVYKLLLTSQLSGEIDVKDATVISLLDICGLCLVNRPNAQPSPPYQLLQHDIFAPFRADLTLAERIVREWLEHGKQN